MPRDLNHPVWDVYDTLRTARLNAKYYSYRVSSLERINFWTELFLAATVTGSAIAGLTFWSTDSGKPIWQSLLVVSAVLAIAKPLLRLADRIQKLQELVGEYRSAEYELKKIEVAIRQERAFGSELQKLFALALDRLGVLAKKPEGEYRISNALRGRCQEEVQRELPSTIFFVPETI